MIPHQRVKNDHYQHKSHSQHVSVLFFSDFSDLYLDISHVNSIDRLLIVQYNNKYESVVIIRDE